MEIQGKYNEGWPVHVRAILFTQLFVRQQLSGGLRPEQSR